MEILSIIGALLFILLWIGAIFVDILEPKGYWDKFIPMIHKKEKKHPVITSFILWSVIIMVMYGFVSVHLRALSVLLKR